MLAILNVPDEVVISFFSVVVAGLTTAVIVLWRQMVECNADRKRIWEELGKKRDKEKP